MRLRTLLAATALLSAGVVPSAVAQAPASVDDPTGDVAADGDPELLTGPQSRAIDLVGATAEVGDGVVRTTGTVAGQLADRRVDEESGTFTVMWQGPDSTSPTAVWVLGWTDTGPTYFAFWDDPDAPGGSQFRESCDDWTAVEDGATVTYTIAWTCVPGIDPDEPLNWQVLAGTGDGSGNSWSDAAPDNDADDQPASGPPLDVPPSAADARPTPTARDVADTCEGRAPRQEFSDTQGNPHEAAIDCVSHYGITQGTSDTEYSPRFPLSRGQTARFLVRTLEAAGIELQQPGDACDDSGSHAESLEVLVASAVIEPPADRNCGEIDAITRADMALWVEGALQKGGVNASDVRDWYVDDEGHPNELEINEITTLGVVTGAGDSRFLPDATLSRAQMATFLARTLDALFDAQAA